MQLNEAKEILEKNGYILDEGIFDSIKNKFFKKKEDTTKVKPASKKLYDDQIEKTSQQAYNHTTESMSTLKQIATNFNGKNAGQLKELWSGLSKLLNKHGMSVKNHDYYLGITNDNTKFFVWAYIANREKDWTDIKVIGTVKANVFEYKYTTNYDLDDSSLKGQADDLNEWLTELDSIALKLFKGVSREEWEEGAHQNESVNKAGYLLEDKYMDDMEDELDSTISFGEIKNIIDKKYKTEIVKDELHVYPLPEKKNIQFRIETRKGTSSSSKFAVYLTQDADEYGYYIKKSYNYYITPKNPECHFVGTDKGSMEEYAGAAEAILEPAEEALKKLMKPGFFKRLFGKKKVEESYKNEIPDDVMELAEEVLNHSCYNLDYDVYQLAEMGEDWLKDLLNELNDREMRIACM